MNRLFALKRCLTVLLLSALGTQAAWPEAFMADTQLAPLQAAARVQVTSIGWMHVTPMMITTDVWARNSRPVDPPQAAKLIELLQQTQALDGPPPRERCRFAPGYQVTFFDAREKVIDSLLICLNCNVLAVGRDTGGLRLAGPARPVRFGEALNLRASLQAWLDQVDADTRRTSNRKRVAQRQ